jgi:hypothetical protein
MTSVTLPAVTERPLDLAATWRRVRLPALLVLLVLGVAVALAVVQNAPPERPLDPRDASPVGARALAQLVRDRGIDVSAATSTSGLTLDPSTTVFVPDPGSVPTVVLRTIANSSADVVVIAPRSRELAALAVPATLAGVTGEQTLDAGCPVGAALVAGDVRFAGLLYRPNGPAASCYHDHGDAGLLVAQRTSARTVVFGSASTFVNRRLPDNGDAALALGLLSSRPHLLWLLPQLPTAAPADAQHKSIVQLLPDRLLWALLQLLVCVVVIGLWRARRLGAVVVEPLPVVVRAAETVEGRARLLRAARARGTAAAALRAATTARLRDLFGLGIDAAAAALVEGAARRTGRAGTDIDALLYGADPPDDAALVRLADDLDRLEQAVRSS